MPRDIEVVGLNPTNYCPVSSSVNPLRSDLFLLKMQDHFLMLIAVKI